jgi:hypothetical protein
VLGRVDEADVPAFALRASARPRRSASRSRGGFDVLDCAQCGGLLRLIALIEEAAVIGRILDLPVARPARVPPLFAAAGAAQTRDY